MKAKALTIALLLSSTSAMATTSQSTVKLVAGDLTPASNLCIIAAQEGIKAAKIAARKMLPKAEKVEYSTTCNGMTLNKFAKQYKLAKVN